MPPNRAITSRALWVFIGIWGEQDGVRLAFGAALVMSTAALVLQQWMIEDDMVAEAYSTDRSDLEPEKNPLKLLKLMNPAMKGLLFTDIMIRFCEQIPLRFCDNLVYEGDFRADIGCPVWTVELD